ncbi:MAG TPA: thiamine pyrophosphate-dependent enzyme, partial [Chthonomonadaceae bacterium]|nr:thiamine pyrophosphate-dependent enzyme [Chthonomonadaceae bacterium]
MSDLSFFYGPNAGYAWELYERYRQDRASVDEATRAYFDALPAGSLEAVAPSTYRAPSAGAPPLSSEPPAAPVENIAHVAAAARLARYTRQRGHLEAHMDPLDLTPRQPAGLELDEHDLTEADLAALPSSVIGGPIAQETANALEAIQRLRQVYSGPIGYDDEHIQNSAERYWLRNAAEGQWFYQDLDAEHKRTLLQRLTEVDTFEQYIHKTWPGQKRFSIEGTDMLVPMLDEIVRNAAAVGTREVVLGMAHRGRLNVLAHVLGKPYKLILAAFDDTKQAQSASVSGGDVKYHLGYQRLYKEGSVEIPIILVPNPSHLEFVNAVAEGHARAAQEDRTQAGEPARDSKGSLPILIHGDAAFPGQGIVAETLNLSRLPGYSTSGTIHIIANNQVGFTTLPSDGRSTLYASDLAKGFEMPIVHVNADDVLACIAVVRMACAYREKFQKDFLIDLIGYRRYGHNESDEPAFTQPKMYEIIDSHARVRDLWAQELESAGIVTKQEAEAMVASVWKDLLSARNAPMETAVLLNGHDNGHRPRMKEVKTGVPQKRLVALNTALTTLPPGFVANPKIERNVLARRREGLTAENGIDW